MRSILRDVVGRKRVIAVDSLVGGIVISSKAARQGAGHVSRGEAATTGGIVLAALGAQEAAAEDQTNGEGTTAGDTADDGSSGAGDDYIFDLQ
jgi:hypothetical protein